MDRNSTMRKSDAIPKTVCLLLIFGGICQAASPDAGKSATTPDFSKLPHLSPQMETWFRNQVGPVWKFDPKGPVVRLLAKVFQDGAPGDRKAKWIDNHPATKPTKPDVPPMLPAKTLYYNAKAVNAHCPVFQRRNPLCAAYLRKVGITPVIDSMPGEDFKKYAETWVSRHNMCYETDPDKFFKAIGLGLLYVDFLACRGGEQGKKDAVTLLTWVSFSFGVHFREIVKDNSIAALVAKEISWPLLDPAKGLWDELLSRYSSVAFKAAKMEKDELDFDKWMVLNAPSNESYKNYLLLNRCNAYSRANDDTGVVLMLHAAYSEGQYDKILDWIRACFVRKYGKKQGEPLYHLYLEAVYAEKKNPVVAKALGLPMSQSTTDSGTEGHKTP